MSFVPEPVSTSWGRRGWRLRRPRSHPPSSAVFTFHQLSQWLKMVTLPTMWLGAASLAWELLTALWRCVVQEGGWRRAGRA